MFSQNQKNVNHNTIVSQVMSDLLISDIENNLIEKCSGGEVKPICVALELTAVSRLYLI